MYVPEAFRLDEPALIARVLREYDFALLVSAVEGGSPVATHLPFTYDAARGPMGVLTAHMARANPQWRDFPALKSAGREALVVFQGPHGYVSPRAYAPGAAVPTWNYVAVHAYGTPEVIEEPEAQRLALERLVEAHETGAPVPWSLDGEDEAFVARMMRGIVVFELPLRRIEAKAKLSQNKGPEDRRGVIAALRARGDDVSADLADWMLDLNGEN